MVDPNDFPHVPPAVVEALQERFRPRDPSSEDTMDTLMWLGGQREVVSFLAEISAQQNERTHQDVYAESPQDREGAAPGRDWVGRARTGIAYRDR